MFSRWLMIVGMLVALCVCAGCSSSGGGAPFQDRDRVAPVVSDFSITPPSGGWRAGTCQIRMRAWDNERIESVTARISGAGYLSDPIVLSLKAGTKDQYEGSSVVPPNLNSEGKAATYSITAWATDNASNSTAVPDSLTFAVPAPDAPLPPPSAW